MRPVQERSGAGGRSATGRARRARGSRGGRQLGEVAVVAGRLDRRAERRVDEAVVSFAARSASSSISANGADTCDDAAGRVVDAVELAVWPETAEHPLALGEQALDRAPLRTCRAADDDVATHRDEPVRVQEPPVESSRHRTATARSSRSRSSRRRPTRRRPDSEELVAALELDDVAGCDARAGCAIRRRADGRDEERRRGRENDVVRAVRPASCG